MPRVHDLALVRPVLRRDPAWSVYALADLAPEHAPYAEWYAPDERSRCAVLLYRGFGFSIFLDSGDFDAVRETIGELAEDRFYLSIRQPTLALLREAGYQVPKVDRLLRMRLDREAFRPGPTPDVMRLTPADAPVLKALYADGAPRDEAPKFFRESMLDEGVYYAAPAEADFAAVAGTHVVSQEEDVAGVGSIYTRLDRRRRGFARQAVTAVLSELIGRGIGTICLNVAVENAAAIALYRSLGFTVHSEYFEGEAFRR